MRRGTGTEHGAALLLALAVTAIMSALLSGILLLSVSHLALSNADSNYANAMNLAEAGVNWELWKLGHDVTTADTTPATVEYPTGSGRTYTVYVEAYPGGGTWIPPNPCRIVSTGTVDGAWRTVRVVAKGVGIFGKYALFGINSLDIGGNATITGAMGTNGPANIDGNPNLDGNFWYCGPAAGGDEDKAEALTDEFGHDVDVSPLPEDYPTVNEAATDWAHEHYGATGPQTVEFFRTHNVNGTIVDSAGAPVHITNYSIDLRTFRNTTGTIILGPGDYYFEGVDLPSSNTIQIDSAAGPVNIWVGPDGGMGKPDTINGKMQFTSQDPSRFHCYDGSNRPLKMNGTMDFYGSFLVYNGPGKNGAYYGTVEVLGTGKITGSVIGYDVYRTSGNAEIIFPSTGGGVSPGEPTDHWGFDRSWEEVNPR